jgi:hypothetical protein
MNQSNAQPLSFKGDGWQQRVALVAAEEVNHQAEGSSRFTRYAAELSLLPSNLSSALSMILDSETYAPIRLDSLCELQHA